MWLLDSTKKKDWEQGNKPGSEVSLSLRQCFNELNSEEDFQFAILKLRGRSSLHAWWGLVCFAFEIRARCMYVYCDVSKIRRGSD